jgi:predicted metal-dependent hydrolase
MILMLDADTPIDVIRTPRKRTASINIVQGHVQVIVPETLSEQRIEAIIQQRRQWIQQKLRLQSEQVPARAKEYVSGESFSYLGKNYRLKVIEHVPTEVKLKCGMLQVGVYPNIPQQDKQDYIRQQLVQWYQYHAKERLQEKTHRFARMLNVKPRSISIRDFSSRWGSCLVTDDISYNWRIVIAPHAIVDYVVVHELCHLLEHNHSEPFWKTVGKIIPNYRECKEWLKLNGQRLIV